MSDILQFTTLVEKLASGDDSVHGALNAALPGFLKEAGGLIRAQHSEILDLRTKVARAELMERADRLLSAAEEKNIGIDSFIGGTGTHGDRYQKVAALAGLGAEKLAQIDAGVQLHHGDLALTERGASSTVSAPSSRGDNGYNKLAASIMRLGDRG